MPTASNPAPQRLGEFVLVGVLGEGGSGIVYDARWGHREIALKVLHPALVATAKEREQFLAEAKRLSEIHHAGVVKVLAVGETPDARPFLAMEKLHGETLAARLARGALPTGPALELFAQLCDAVEALHARGLVHRDLKPENVVLVDGADGKQHAVLLDFGIAKELASQPSTTTQEGGVRGTPAYMAPERFFGQPASISTDVYELAVTLFAMLAGRLPWGDAGDPDARLDPARLIDLAPHVPAALDVEVRRALSTRAQNRPSSAAELRNAVMSGAGLPWSPRHTVDVKSGPISLPSQPQPQPQPFPSGFSQTVDLRSTRAPVRRTRWLLLFAAIAVVATGIGLTAHYLTRPADTIEPQKAAVAAMPDAGIPTFLADAAPAPAAPDVAAHRAALKAALAHLPDDELFAFGVQLAELEHDPTLRPIIDLFTDSTAGKMLVLEADLGTCELDFRGRADWFVAAGPADESALDAIASGRWTKDEIERCLDGQTLTWLDDRTFLMTSRKVDGAWLEARKADASGLPSHLRPALEEIDVEGMLWFAGDEQGTRRAQLSDGTEFQGLWGALAAEEQRVSLEMWIKYADAKTAAAQQADLEKTVGGLGIEEPFGHLTIERDPHRKDVVHVDIAMARMVAAAVVEAAGTRGLTP